MHARAEDFGLRQDAHAADAINLHLHVRIAVGVAQVGEMGAPGRVFGVALDDDGVFVESVGEREGGLGFLPAVQIVGLFTAKPFGEGAPDIC